MRDDHSCPSSEWLNHPLAKPSRAANALSNSNIYPRPGVSRLVGLSRFLAYLRQIWTPMDTLRQCQFDLL